MTPEEKLLQDVWRLIAEYDRMDAESGRGPDHLHDRNPFREAVDNLRTELLAIGADPVIATEEAPAITSVAHARTARVCRICGVPIPVPPGQPLGWESEFGEMVWPVAITLDFGNEFAHTGCLPKEEEEEEEE